MSQISLNKTFSVSITEIKMIIKFDGLIDTNRITSTTRFSKKRSKFTGVKKIAEQKIRVIFTEISKRFTLAFVEGLTIIWSYMLANNFILMRPITSSVLVLALWILGSSIVSYLAKNQDLSFESVPSSSGVEDTARSSFSLKSFFLLQSPLVSAGAIAIIGCLSP